MDKRCEEQSHISSVADEVIINPLKMFCYINFTCVNPHYINAMLTTDFTHMLLIHFIFFSPTYEFTDFSFTEREKKSTVISAKLHAPSKT